MMHSKKHFSKNGYNPNYVKKGNRKVDKSNMQEVRGTLSFH